MKEVLGLERVMGILICEFPRFLTFCRIRKTKCVMLLERYRGAVPPYQNMPVVLRLL